MFTQFKTLAALSGLILLSTGCGGNAMAMHNSLRKAIHGSGSSAAKAVPEDTPAPADPPADTAAPAPESVPANPSAGAGQQASEQGEWKEATPPPSANEPPADSPSDGAEPSTGVDESDRQAAPPFDVTTLDGRHVTSAGLYGTRPVSITIWATWCGPCRLEAPVINKLYGQYNNQVEFIAVSIDQPDARRMVEKFVQQNGLKYPVAHDTSGKVARDFSVQSIPMTVLVDDQGKVANLVVGFQDEDHLVREFEGTFKLSGSGGSNGDTYI